MYRYLWVWYDVYGFWLLSRRNVISIVWRNWIRSKLISSSYLPINRYLFSRRPWKYHSARQGRFDWTCFISLANFYLVSRKTFLLYSILTFHKVFFALQIIEVHTYLCLYCIILCCWIKHRTWHWRVAIQFEYCDPTIGLCIDIYEYGMLSMGFDCCLEERVLMRKNASFVSIVLYLVYILGELPNYLSYTWIGPMRCLFCFLMIHDICFSRFVEQGFWYRVTARFYNLIF